MCLVSLLNFDDMLYLGDFIFLIDNEFLMYPVTPYLPTSKSRVNGFSGKKAVEGFSILKTLKFSIGSNYEAKFVTYFFLNISVTRSYSTLPYKPENLAMCHMKSKKPTTCEVINSLLLNQEVSISEADLNKLLRISYVEFKLPLSANSYLAYVNLVGKPGSRGKFAGVYVFTHIETGQKYVGSSNMLGRRLSQYFEPEKGFVNKKDSGLLLPLIKKDGFSKFTLKIYVMSPDSSISYDYLFLEQYFLLDSSFTLNTQRIVNFRVKQGTRIYVYNEDFSVLYHTSLSFNMLKKEIGIHISNIKSSLEKGEMFLNTFRITTVFYPNAAKSEMSLQELNNFMDLKRKEKLLNNRAKSIYLYNKDLTIFYYMSNSQSALRSALGISADSVRNCINTGSLYLDYFSIKSEPVAGVTEISISFTEFKDLLISKRKEHRLKSLKLGSRSGSINISVIYKESGLVKDFPSITSASKYLKSEGITVDAATITKYLNSDVAYKGFLFRVIK